MTKKKIIVIGGILVAGIILIASLKKKTDSGTMVVTEIRPVIGNITEIITTTGIVEPQNRLEIKPPINGRINEILVEEGDIVEKGQILAWMSSADRAALLDAARAKGEEEVNYWREVYKPTPLISPIDGNVIARILGSGQTVTTAEPVLILSDRLIVNAQLDETDIGDVRLEQKAVIVLDAYPGRAIDGVVGHIAYESKTVNSVTIYEVDIIPAEIPDFFRAGMSATVDIIEKGKKDVMLLPLKVVTKEEGKTYVFVKKGRGDKLEKKEIEAGLDDGINVEILAGLQGDSVVVMKQKAYSLPKKDIGTSPFMPQRKKRQEKRE